MSDFTGIHGPLGIGFPIWRDPMNHPDQPRELDEQGHQIANLTEGDPGNTDPELLTAPLDPDDDVYTLVDDERRELEQQDQK